VTDLHVPLCTGRSWVAPSSPDYVRPGTDYHSRVISPSKVAAIMGVSRWDSAFRLWHMMKGLIDGEPESDRFMVGHAMELAAAYMYREDHPGWRVSTGEVQVQTDMFGFPAVATLDRRCTRPKGRGVDHRVLEVKTTESLEDWGDQRTDQAPMDYTVQITALMGFTGYTEHPAHLLLLGPRISQRHEYEIPFAEDIWEWILEECGKFYETLDLDDPPPLDNSVATYQAVRDLHPDIERCIHDPKTKACGGVEVPAGLIHRITDAQSEVARWKAEERGGKAELLTIMERAQHARVDDVIAARRQNSGKGTVALVMTGAELPTTSG
jgi:predicted phage-related endonuclease